MAEKNRGHVKLGYRSGTGQYREHIDCRMYYSGAEEKRAIRRDL